MKHSIMLGERTWHCTFGSWAACLFFFLLALLALLVPFIMWFWSVLSCLLVSQCHLLLNSVMVDWLSRSWCQSLLNFVVVEWLKWFWLCYLAVICLLLPFLHKLAFTSLAVNSETLVDLPQS